MKWLLTTSMGLVFVLGGCSASQSDNANTMTTFHTATQHQTTTKPISFVDNLKIHNNTYRLNKVLSYVKTRVGKTWYVFSGVSPIYGWDCSGLVYWTYSKLGVSLKHSASIEVNAGIKVKTPKVGDIVGFGWKGWNGAQHVGIYLGNGMMIHAGGARGQKTAIISISKWAKENGNTKITYTRVLPTA